MAMQALKISFITPTNSHGTRVKVSAPQGMKKYGYDHALSNEANALEAAKQFASDLGWSGELILGGIGTAEYVAVFLPVGYTKAAV